MTIRAFWCAGLLWIAASCSAPELKPKEVPPLMSVPLEKPLRESVLAILDFDDQRPREQRGEGALNDGFISSGVFLRDIYWSIQPSDPGNLPVDVQTDEYWRARYTGTGSFSWFPFPYTGSALPRSGAISKSLADYFALTLERRGVSSKVIRVTRREDAVEAGAEMLLTGTITDFGGVFAELKHESVHSDDPSDFVLLGSVGIDMRLSRLNDDSTVWQEKLEAREVDPNLFDRLYLFRGSEVIPVRQLDHRHILKRAYHDMVVHVKRPLESITRLALTRLEENMKVGPSLD